MNKLTEEQLINGFKFCYLTYTECDACPIGDFLDECNEKLIANRILDLIIQKDAKIIELTDENNRQNAEIENLRHIVRVSDENQNELINTISQRDAQIERLQEKLKGQKAIATNFGLSYTQAKSEAIKEFAERLKTLLYMPDNMVICRTVYTDEIDNLVKEMVGE